MEITEEGLKEIMDFLHEIGKLKEVKRQGWVVSGVKDAQNSAEHSFRFALMAMVLGGGRGIDVDKAIKMGLIHDLAEARIGDIITWKGLQMGEKEKLQKERKAITDMVKSLGETGKEILELWEEFEFGGTPEARFAKEVDKLEMVFQAFEYEKDERVRDTLNSCINTFYDYDDKDSAGAVRSEDLRKLTDRIMKLRKGMGFDKGNRYPKPETDK
jgi:putative hydrolase of HD superfamily